MGHKKKSFRKTWTNQTELGRAFGITAIAVGKALSAAGLKGPEGATKKALDEGFAIATPLKDGTAFFMWNIERIKALLGKEHKALTPFEMYVQEVKEDVKAAQAYDDEGDKMGRIMWDMMFDGIPGDLRSGS